MCPTSSARLSGGQFPAVGTVLTGSEASWLPGSATHSHSWSRCVRLSCSAIAGATGTQYTVAAADVGTRLLFNDTASSSGAQFTSTSGPSGIVVMRLENTNGSQIAYASNRDGAQSHIYSSAADGTGGATQLTSTVTGTGDVQPNWSTHGDSSVLDRIAFSSNGKLSWVTATGTVSSVGAVSGSWPSVRRNGTRIAYSTGTEINLVDPDGSNITTVDSDVNEFHPSYAGDGARVTFEAGGNIWIAQANTSHQFSQLTTGGTDHEPSWSQDGSSIVFVRSGQLWTMDADGLSPVHLDTPGLTVADPAWSLTRTRSSSPGPTPAGTRTSIASTGTGPGRLST